jgi:hypothetical protein
MTNSTDFLQEAKNLQSCINLGMPYSYESIGIPVTDNECVFIKNAIKLGATYRGKTEGENVKSTADVVTLLSINVEYPTTGWSDFTDLIVICI